MSHHLRHYMYLILKLVYFGRRRQEIFDIRKLSHLNLSLDNIAFQVCPSPKGGENFGSGIWPRKGGFNVIILKGNRNKD